ncbi:MAG: hypothetical protein CAF41_003675 [Nitrospira sp. CG24A]|nr:MAG: hypothetical protein CAF41_003675 [Nitrospira sp. CG24A]
MSTTVTHNSHEHFSGHRQTAALAYERGRFRNNPLPRHTVMNHAARCLSPTAIHHESKDTQAEGQRHTTKNGRVFAGIREDFLGPRTQQMPGHRSPQRKGHAEPMPTDIHD